MFEILIYSNKNLAKAKSRFDAIDNFNIQPLSGNVVERYLADRVEMVTDPLTWWSSHVPRAGAAVTPFNALAQMAVDFLSAPGEYLFCFLTFWSHFLCSLLYRHRAILFCWWTSSD